MTQGFLLWRVSIDFLIVQCSYGGVVHFFCSFFCDTMFFWCGISVFQFVVQSCDFLDISIFEFWCTIGFCNVCFFGILARMGYF